MSNLELLNNFSDALCVISKDKEVIFKNTAFTAAFPYYKSIGKFKKRFNFDLCFLSSEGFENKTPVDFMLNSEENFHTICSYTEENGALKYYYIYSFIFEGEKTAVFKDMTSVYDAEIFEKQYKQLKSSYDEIKSSASKFEKLKEHAQTQALKMGIISRISLIIRETNDVQTIISSALKEIQNLAGSFKTYFAYKYKNGFKTAYSIPEGSAGIYMEYESSTAESIKNKNITAAACLREYLNAPDILPEKVNRIIIPVYYKNSLPGIIVTFTRRRSIEKENREILQAIAVQLAGAVIQADLIQKLDRKNKKLKSALTELKETQIQLINTEKTASIGQLAAGIAHEINTPLASINSNNGIIKKIINSSGSVSAENLNILRELNDLDGEAAKRISDIVKSLKRYIRLDEAELQAADINSELDLTLKLAMSEIKKNTKIIKKYGVLPPVKCRINMINQVFMNLIVNACQSIDSSNPEGAVEIETSAENGVLTVKIKDNGCGIPLKNQNKIFKAGFTSKKAGMGTGLGLSISKKIIEMHKGSINFTSKENEGSVFTVALPIN